jgi:hypothetical protein
MNGGKNSTYPGAKARVLYGPSGTAEAYPIQTFMRSPLVPATMMLEKPSMRWLPATER